jgi:hypothetical protein
LRQLKPMVVYGFNQEITNRKGVQFSILVGTAINATCDADVPGDGVVPIPSAMWQIKDKGFIFRIHTELTGRDDFIIFVKPRLAVGPKKAATAKLESDKNSDFAVKSINENLLASLDPLPFIKRPEPPKTSSTKIVAARNVKIKAGEAAEVPVSFAANLKNGATFLSSPNMTVSLVDSTGETVEKIESGSDLASAVFKTFYSNGKTGNFVLRFENTGEEGESVFVSLWTSSNLLSLEFVEILKQTDASVKLQAKLTSNGEIVKGASVSAKISGQNVETPLLDDGKHGDGEANDGVYGATSGKLPDGDYLIEASAAAAGASASTATVLKIGGQ